MITIFWSLGREGLANLAEMYHPRDADTHSITPFTLVKFRMWAMPFKEPYTSLPASRKHGATSLAQTLFTSSIVSRSRVARHTKRSERS
jgi:hypothetical protein